jgi:hypothetical protein
MESGKMEEPRGRSGDVKVKEEGERRGEKRRAEQKRAKERWKSWERRRTWTWRVCILWAEGRLHWEIMG